MSLTRPPYPSGFRKQMVELVRSGRSPEELAREFEATQQSIRNWVSQADRDEGRSCSRPVLAIRTPFGKKLAPPNPRAR